MLTWRVHAAGSWSLEGLGGHLQRPTTVIHPGKFQNVLALSGVKGHLSNSLTIHQATPCCTISLCSSSCQLHEVCCRPSCCPLPCLYLDAVAAHQACNARAPNNLHGHLQQQSMSDIACLARRSSFKAFGGRATADSHPSAPRLQGAGSLCRRTRSQAAPEQRPDVVSW